MPRRPRKAAGEPETACSAGVLLRRCFLADPTRHPDEVRRSKITPVLPDQLPRRRSPLRLIARALASDPAAERLLMSSQATIDYWYTSPKQKADPAQVPPLAQHAARALHLQPHYFALALPLLPVCAHQAFMGSGSKDHANQQEGRGTGARHCWV